MSISNVEQLSRSLYGHTTLKVTLIVLSAHSLSSSSLTIVSLVSVCVQQLIEIGYDCGKQDEAISRCATGSAPLLGLFLHYSSCASD